MSAQQPPSPMAPRRAPLSSRCSCWAPAPTPSSRAWRVAAQASCRPPRTPRSSRRAGPARAALGDRAFVLGHHYQRDEVIAFADVTGDSFKLAQQAAARPDAEYVVFCGVHFMAESADILTAAAPAGDPARPGGGLLDGRHGGHRPGRGMLGGAGGRRASPMTVIPVTYMNSSADIKAFTGRHGGTVCTSSNAPARPGLGAGPGQQGPLPARPAPGPQHRRAGGWG